MPQKLTKKEIKTLESSFELFVEHGATHGVG